MRRGFAHWMTGLWVGAVVICCSPASEPGMASSLVPSPPPASEPLLALRLRERAAEVASAPREPLAQGESLSAARVAELLGRLPGPPEPAPSVAFRKRDDSPPPPRAGETIALPFPPPDDATPPAPEGGDGPKPLAVTRRAPEGEVAIAPHLGVTFSQPMVPLGAQDEVATRVPVQVSPEPAGQWRWLGTQTLVFEPDARFPMATDYRVTVARGAEAASGAVLAEEVSFGFSTPPVSIVRKAPTGIAGLEPVIFLEFDQRIDREALMPYLSLHGRRAPRLRLASDEEIEGDAVAAALHSRATEGRWLALVPTRALARDRAYEVRLDKGAPSAEGPRESPKAERFEFRTYAPLEVVEASCGRDRACRPGEPWRIRFNNALSGEPPELEIRPALTPVRVELAGNSLWIAAPSQGRTQYQVTLPGELQDVYAQRMGRDQRLTLEVGSAEPTLRSPAGRMVTLDPHGEPALPIFTVNYDEVVVRIARVEPGQLEAWTEWRNQLHRPDASAEMPGELLLDRKLQIEGEPDRMTETRIDLAPYLREGTGQLAVWVEPVDREARAWRWHVVASWVQVTRIGLAAFQDAKEVVVWASALADGAPLDGVEIDFGNAIRATTDQSGLARVAMPRAGASRRVPLIARLGSDLAILGSGLRSMRAAPDSSLRWYSFDDRGIYRPGESGRLKGWLRRWGHGAVGDIEGLGAAPSRVAWYLTGARGRKLAEGEAAISSLGGFDLAFALPDDANLGDAWLSLAAADPDPDWKKRQGVASTGHRHRIRVEEFRRPEFEVATRAGEGPLLVGGEARVEVEASYYAGGALGDAPVHWEVAARAAHFTPPNHDDYHFGRWRPWWIPIGPMVAPPVHVDLDGRTDAAGRHRVAIELGAMPEPQPVSLVASASVRDVNRQTWQASETLLVHPAELYVGLRTPRSFVGRGEVIALEGVVADLEGHRVPGVEVEVALERLRWRYDVRHGAREPRQEREHIDMCRVRSSDAAFACRFEPELGGSYRVTASLRDGEGRPNETQLNVWVAGGEGVPSRGLEREQVQIIPDRERYEPGDTARVLIQSPFHPAQGVLSLRRSGLVSTRRFELSGPEVTLEVPIESGHIPNLTLQVDLVGAAPRRDDAGQVLSQAPPRVAHAGGQIALKIPPLERTLRVEAAPVHSVTTPGSAARIEVQVRDSQGRPAADAEVAVVVVDEAVLALTGYTLPDPLEVFYAPRGAGVFDQHLRDQLLLDVPPELETTAEGEAMAMSAGTLARSRAAPRSAVVMAEADASTAGQDTAMRQDFSALAAFVPRSVTDEAGRAVVDFRLSDSLTRYRVMAVAAAGGRDFGKGESSLTTRLPLMLRPSPPRFLHFGDRFALSLVLQNPGERDRSVDVAVRSQGAALQQGEERVAQAGQRVVVPAHGRREVRFEAAAEEVGTAGFQAIAASGDDSDAASFALPVYTPATTEAFATYGSLEQGVARQPVQVPADVWPQLGGLEVQTSSTQLQALTDAFLYLVRYPFDCTEQLASRVLAVAALRDVLHAFQASGLPDAEALQEAVEADLAALASRQSGNGSFGLWRRGGRDWPFASLHAAHAFARARSKGHAVDEAVFARSRRYAEHIEKLLPADYSVALKRSLRAYALYVLAQMDVFDAKAARRLLAEGGPEGLSLEAQGWILPVLERGGAKEEVAEILRLWRNRVAESASAAHFATGYGDDGGRVLFHSDRRVDGVLLEALIAVRPDSDLVPKLARGLLAHRKQGRWSNTQENAFILLALDRYFHVYEGTTPDFLARVWVGDRFAAERRFVGRTTERVEVALPMRELMSSDANDLIIAKDGPGRLYYRMGMRYAPRSLELGPAERGFAVRRSYEAVDDDGDVARDEDGTWRIRAGARVRVRLAFTTPMRRTHVALVDPLPAGFEALNPALAVTDATAVPASQTRPRFWWRQWYEHQNLRDERVEAFTSLLYAGVYEYTYLARATTPGEFVAPPLRAEEMYHPETFGRSSTDRVIVFD